MKRQMIKQRFTGQQISRLVLGLCAALVMIFAQASMASAASITALKLLSDGSGQSSLRIGMDAAAEYQVFNLDGPKRLVLSFPAVTLSDSIDHVQGADGVKRVVAQADSSGARIEIGLDAGTTYNIEEKGTDLLITFNSKAAGAAKAAGAVLEDIQVKDKGGMTELILRGRNMDVNHDALVTNDGKNMVLDFWGGQTKLPKDYYTFTSQRINDISIGSANGRMRLVVALRSGLADKHQIDASPNQTVIRFGKIKTQTTQSGMVVEAVDFQPDDRIAHLVVRTDNANPIINLQEEDGRIVLDVQHAHLAAGQQRTQDVRAFPGPVKQIDSYAVGKDVRIVARLREKSVVTSYQTGNVLTVTMKPVDMVAAARADDKVVRQEKVYTGQKVTFNYKDIDIRNALKLIAEMSDVNIIMSDDVKGVLTMRLVDVPWDQALDLILTAKGLGKEKNGNVMRIAPLAVLKADADSRKEAKKSAEDIAPLETEFITLGYASVNDVRTILKGGTVNRTAATTSANNTSSTQTGQSGGSTSSGELKLLSSRGTIMLDERSNMMIITDTRERLNNIKRLIAVIDKPAQQVLIEARIVEASDSFARDLGVRWGGNYASGKGRNGNITNQFTHGLTGGVGNGNVVDLGAAVAKGAGGAIGYTLGTFSNALNLNLELSAAEQEGKIKVVSSPRVFTSNLKLAKISQITNLYFPQSTSTGQQTTTGTNTTTPIPIPLSLEVTPQVTADKRIIMLLKVTKGTPVVSTTGAASIDTKSVETSLLVKNGETVVLGGIYTQTTTNKTSGVPGLMNIPLIGHLFKHKIKTNNRNELLIFISPTIIDESISANK